MSVVGIAGGPEHVTSTLKCLKTPSHGSPNTAVVAAMAQLGFPTHSLVTMATVVCASHVLRVNPEMLEQSPVGVPKEAKTTDVMVSPAPHARKTLLFSGWFA